MRENRPPDDVTPRIGDPLRLPGVGTRVDFVDETGAAFSVVNRDDGEVEIYVPGGSGGPSTLRLADTTAHALGALLAGRYELDPSLSERAARVLGGLTFDWVRITPDARAAGKTLGELEIRKRTGVTIVAILRGQVPIVAPEPDTTLLVGDDVVIVSRPTDLAAGRTELGGSR